MTNTIYSKTTNSFIPIKVEKCLYGRNSTTPQMVEYNIYDNHKKVGFVHLQDTEKGCYVQFIKNERPEEYGGFGYLADKIEVQHCMERGMSDFEINSYASMNSHAKHYLRGKRFIGTIDSKQKQRFQELFANSNMKNFNVNNIVKYVIAHTPNGEKFNTWFLKQVSMYMPKGLIKKYIKELKENPIKIIMH